MNAKSNDISTRFVKCPILSKRASFSEANFLPKKRAVLFPHKNHKNDLVEKKHAVPGAHRHIRLSLSLSLSLFVFLYSVLIFSDSMRSTRGGLDGRVLSASSHGFGFF